MTYTIEREHLKNALSWINRPDYISERERDKCFVVLEMLGMPVAYASNSGDLVLTDDSTPRKGLFVADLDNLLSEK